MKLKNKSNFIISKLNIKNSNNKALRSIYHIVINENYLAIISLLNYRSFKKLLLQVIISKKIFLFVIKNKEKIVGYSIYSDRPSQMFKDANNIKFTIITNLITSFNFKTIINLVIKFLEIDKILLSKKKKKIYNETLNLSYLAIKKKYQSRGIGKYFVIETLKRLKKNYGKSAVTVDTKDPKTKNFYLKKCKFTLLGEKIELFKSTSVFFKKI
tara:strand:- start:26 stop:664 length:639 start_codon:yes stop_codon:yes gene_type:complete